jgi:hypothetical protein
MTTNEHTDRRQVTIIVNTRRFEWSSRQISYEEVYELAFPNQPLGDGDTATIEYSRGAHGHGTGALTPSHKVQVKDGMVFDVYRTTRS